MITHNLGFIIGRFQPFHEQHCVLLLQALMVSSEVVICIGSCNQHRTTKNPLTFEERVQLIKHNLSPDQAKRVFFEPIEDTDIESEWYVDITERLSTYASQRDTILVGHNKDDSSYYLENFSGFDYYPIESSSDLSATDIRDTWYKGLDMFDGVRINPRTANWLEGFRHTEEFFKLKEQYKFKDYPYKGSLNICTADALVVNGKEEYLFITRKFNPHKGMLAFAGGHKDSNETFYECAKRELEEETGLSRKDIILTVVGNMFDNPDRDPVMTKVSIPFLFTLVSDKKVVALDDALEVHWLTEEEVHNNKHKIAFDHYKMFLDLKHMRL